MAGRRYTRQAFFLLCRSSFLPVACPGNGPGADRPACRGTEGDNPCVSTKPLTYKILLLTYNILSLTYIFPPASERPANFSFN